MLEEDKVEGIIYRVCIDCNEEMPRGCFRKNNCYADGWSHKCIVCLGDKKKTGVYKDEKFAKKQVGKYGYVKI